MQDTTPDSFGPVSSSAQRTAHSEETTRASPTSNTAASQSIGHSPAPIRPASRRLAIDPLWLAVGAAALFGLVFGFGALTGSTGTSRSASSAPSGTAIEQQTINTIRTVDPSVVQVQARGSGTGSAGSGGSGGGGGGGGGGGVGSGEILTPSGYIVTNDHVVRGFTTYTVLLADGRQLSAQLVGEAPTQDLAVLKITARNLKPITVGDSSKVLVGEYALAIGSPLGLEQSATAGIISALNRQANTEVAGQVVTMTGLIQTSAPINPGNSGGALVNLRGELIGIPTLGAVEPSSGVAANGIGFAIASNRMATIVRQLTGGAA